MNLITNSKPNEKLTSKLASSLTDVKSLRLALDRLPPFHLISQREDLTLEQQWLWKNQENTWKLIGTKIDYLQLEDMGFIFEDPFDNPEFDPALKIYLDITANTLFAELNLMIAGWELIKEKALKNKKNFPFNNPRKLFAEYCKQRAVIATQDFLSTDINQGEPLTEIRQYYRDLGALYRGRLEEDEETRAISDFLNSDDWFRFTVCAIWKCRTKKFNRDKLKRAWGEFLKAFKDESAMVCNKNFFKKYGVKLSRLKWNEGMPANTKSGCPAVFEAH
jgi:hypothetical protein